MYRCNRTPNERVARQRERGTVEIVDARKHKRHWIFDLEIRGNAVPVKICGFKYYENGRLDFPERRGSRRGRGNKLLLAVTFLSEASRRALAELCRTFFTPRIERSRKIRATTQRSRSQTTEEKPDVAIISVQPAIMPVRPALREIPTLRNWSDLLPSNEDIKSILGPQLLPSSELIRKGGPSTGEED